MKRLHNLLTCASQSELAFRYFSCEFLLHRPVLYFFLHRDIEYSVRPPPEPHSPADMEPGVLASARECVRAAVQMVWFARQNMHGRLSWCDMQMLFAAYLVILQARGVGDLNGLFLPMGGAEEVLAGVEMATGGAASMSRVWALVRGVKGVG